MIIVGLDVETTGTGLGSEIVEVGWCVYHTEKNAPLAGGHEIFQPEGWSKAAEEVHQISQEMVSVAGLKAKDFDLYGRISPYRPQAVVAHNAPFDHKFISKWWPRFCELPWVCTMDDLHHGLIIPYFKKWGYSKKIHLIAADYGIRYEMDDLHRAYTDAVISCKIAARHINQKEPDGLRHICTDKINALQYHKFYRDVILKGPYVAELNTDSLVKYGFRYEGQEDKSWHKIVQDPENNKDFIEWMEDNCPPQWMETLRIEPLCGPVCSMRKIIV